MMKNNPVKLHFEDDKIVLTIKKNFHENEMLRLDKNALCILTAINAMEFICIEDTFLDDCETEIKFLFVKYCIERELRIFEIREPQELLYSIIDLCVNSGATILPKLKNEFDFIMETCGKLELDDSSYCNSVIKTILVADTSSIKRFSKKFFEI